MKKQVRDAVDAEMARNTPVTAAIHRLLTADPYWSTQDPRTEINRGNCEDFMMSVRDIVPEAKERTTGPFIGPNGEEIVGAFDDAGHYWIEFNGRHYDAECPEGVDRMEDLPIFRRFVGR